ncbi:MULTISPECIES: DivIVA domain-containing protein [unclassified Streptomyces]|uniref:DivIVA domain-containing protein n=1 Tax=unclassified Streptomyces TaxID=2593676 RepID=UPI002251B5F5|nr:MULTISPECIES: DivIVA domain-containing protein [unclassified Streptomyces]MCX4526227.1 DivIVA domain-containing protein [Streptomyces sp. NBC_01551]MCX4543209.1 DivIVA domain-containing protein [Streptomyces sp. NBC_01565]
MSPHGQGFGTVRGRGYRTDQVDRYLARLSDGRDEAWERVARLTVLAKRMEAEAGRLREAVSALAPQRYDDLSERARRILLLAEEEAEAVRGEARADVLAIQGAAEAHADRAAELARQDAEAVREQTEVRARQLLLRAQREADGVRAEARDAAAQWRAEGQAALAEMVRRSEALLAEREQERVERRDAAERELAARVEESEARHLELDRYAEARLAEARRAFAEAEESARHGQEDAEARGAELVAAARVREERVGRETERILREHAESQEEMRAHMNHVRSSLAALTGRAPAEG